NRLQEFFYANYRQNAIQIAPSTGFNEGYAKIFDAGIQTFLLSPQRNIKIPVNITLKNPLTSTAEMMVKELYRLKNGDALKKKHYSIIKSSFNEITQGYDFDIQIDDSNDALLFFSLDGAEVNANDSGLGFQDLIAILFFAHEPKKKLILIEEPENHLHPEMQRRLLAHLFNIADKQFFLTTHSNIFLDPTYVDKIFITTYDGEVHVTDAFSKAEALNELGYSVIDNLVSDLIILTEGPTDIPILEQLLAQLKLYDKYNIKLWPLGGDIMDQVDLSVWSENYKVMAIVDSDPGSQKIRERFIAKCEEANVKVTRLKRYSIENYFPLRALRSVFKGQIDDSIVEIKPNMKLEEQIHINVKKNNRKIAREMTVDEIMSTEDLYGFLNEVKKTLE
ncbi:MAG TPA: AAA family ATPase, partial [Candidatus Kapabacteria bacterium]|nr:AAA family ATPase [Candidatus Kapabacteria bacterium]